jgi:ANTH domain
MQSKPQYLSYYMILSNPHDCTKFYLDDLEDELTIAALQMLVKDLLILFQAVNEGVINVLGNNPD